MWLKGIVSARPDPAAAFQLFQVLRQATILIAGIFLAKWLSIEEVGIFETWLYIGSILTFFWVPGMMQAYSAESSNELFSSTTYLLLLGGSAIFATGFYLLRSVFIPLFTGLEDIPQLHLYLVYFMLQIPALLLPFHHLVRGQAKALLRFSVLFFAGFLLAVGAATILFQSLRAIVIGLIIFGVGQQLYLLFHIKLGFLSSEKITRFLKRSLPLGLYAAMGSFAYIIDSWLVQHYFTLENFAIFRFGARELPIASALGTAFSTAMIVHLTNNEIEGLDRIKRGTKRLLSMIIPLAIVLMIFSSQLYTIVYSSDFTPAAGIFNIYLFILFSRLLFPVPVFIFNRGETLLLIVSFTELIINVIVSVFLMKYLGLAGIAWGTVIAYTYEKAALLFLAKRKYGIPPSAYIPIPLLLLLLIAMVCTYLIFGYG